MMLQCVSAACTCITIARIMCVKLNIRIVYNYDSLLCRHVRVV